MCLYFHAHARKQFSFETYQIMMPKEKEKRKIRLSEENKLFRLKLKPCRGRENLVLFCPLKVLQINVHIQNRENKKPSFWIQQHVRLILLDNGELNHSTFDPLLCEAHYYLFWIIVHFKSRTMKKHVRTLKALRAFPESSVRHFFGNISAEAVRWLWVGVRDGCLCFPFSNLFTLNTSPWKQGLLLRWR